MYHKNRRKIILQGSFRKELCKADISNSRFKKTKLLNSSLLKGFNSKHQHKRFGISDYLVSAF